MNILGNNAMKTTAIGSDDWFRARLALPRSSAARRAPLRVVIDTDTANEIDDQFALTWALLSPDRLQIEALYAAPYSFAHRRDEMLRADAARQMPDLASALDLELLAEHGAALDHFARRGWDLATVRLPVFDSPALGMERSHAEILQVFGMLGIDPAGKVFRGSAAYLPAADAPVDSEAARHLIALARATADDAPPLYVVAIGCVTNIASALLMAPDIARKIIVVWTAGYPSHAPHANHAFNLEQDMHASRHLFDSGVPLVYLPGYHVGAQLRLSLPEIERHVQGRGAIGDYLRHLFVNNPLADFLGIEPSDARSWVIWDLICFAWLIDPSWVPSEIVTTPCLGADKRWQHPAGRHPMREGYAVARDAIFGDFFERLGRAKA